MKLSDNPIVLPSSCHSQDKATPEQIWIRQLSLRMPFGRLLAAVANQHARQI